MTSSKPARPGGETVIRHIQSLPFARILTLMTSLIGIALIAIVYSVAATGGSPRPSIFYVFLAFPFLLGLFVSLLPMEHRSRIVLLWLAASAGGVVAALTVFSGIGFFLLAIIFAYLWAAWQENEAGE